MNDLSLRASIPAELTLLSSGEASEFLRISTPTLKRMALGGEIPFVRLGSRKNSPRKYRLADLQEFITSHLSNSTENN